MRNIAMLDQDGSGLASCLRQGNFKSAAAGGGYQITRSTNTASRRVYADDGGAALNGTGSVPDLRANLTRFLLTTSHTGGHIRAHALMGQLKSVNAPWNTEVASAVHGRMELVRSSGTFTLGGYGVSAAVLGVTEASGAITVNTNHVMAGVAAISDFKATLTQTGVVTAFYAGAYDTTNWSDGTARTTWGYGLYIKSAAIDIRLAGGPCVLSGTGDPNGNSAYSAPKGSVFLRSDNSSHDDTIYVNTNGTTGWSAMVSA